MNETEILHRLAVLYDEAFEMLTAKANSEEQSETADAELYQRAPQAVLRAVAKFLAERQ